MGCETMMQAQLHSKPHTWVETGLAVPGALWWAFHMPFRSTPNHTTTVEPLSLDRQATLTSETVHIAQFWVPRGVSSPKFPHSLSQMREFNIRFQIKHSRLPNIYALIFLLRWCHTIYKE